jgi:hypothetical protein
MKKLQLKVLELGSKSFMTREQMKDIKGGHSIGGPVSCSTSSCPPTQFLCIVVDGNCEGGCGTYCSPICPEPPICGE